MRFYERKHEKKSLGLSELSVPRSDPVLEVPLHPLDLPLVRLDLLVHDLAALGLLEVGGVGGVVAAGVDLGQLGLEVVQLGEADLEVVELGPDRLQLLAGEVHVVGEFPEAWGIEEKK